MSDFRRNESEIRRYWGDRPYDALQNGFDRLSALAMLAEIARLSAVEQERDEYKAAGQELLRNVDSLIAERGRAEARVEALTAAAERFRAAIDAPSHDGWLTELNAAEAALDAALCAPPVPETRQ